MMHPSTANFSPEKFDILIVDDNPENLKVLGDFLVGQGYHVRAARDGRQALASVMAQPPSLILLDIHMPVLDGYETCCRLKAIDTFQDTPVIFLSALGETFNKVRAFECGGVDYMTKPFELEEVRVRVANHLHASQLLAESKAGFRASFDQAAVGMAHIQLDGRLHAANRRLGEMLGYDAHTLLSRSLTDLFTADAAAFVAGAIQNLAGGGCERTATEIQALRRNGESLWCRVALSLIRVSPGSAPYVAAIVEDISERKQAEEDRWRLAAALEQSPDAVVITDGAWAVLYANAAYEKASGSARAEFVGRPLPLVTDAPGNEERAGEIRAALSSGAVWNGRVSTPGKNGAARIVEHTVSPLRDGRDSIVNYVAISRDITRQCALEEQLRQSQKMEAIGTLAAGIAHDFNNLLAAIGGFTELAIEDISPDSEAYLCLREASGATRRATELVRQILAFGRQSEYAVRPVLVQDVAREVLRLLRRTIPPHIAIQQELDEDCESIMADSTAIHQVLMNLCTNAYHAMQEQGGELGVRVSQIAIGTEDVQGLPDLPAGDFVRIDISDTGHGMDERTRQRIFEPYFTTKERGGGTGLGLATVHGIVAELQGAVHVYSELGAGSTFSVFLPAAPADCTAEPGESARRREHGNGEHILFVDDEQTICRFAEKALVRLGYRATTRSNPAEALATFSATPGDFDAIITDEMMPGIRGSQLLSRFREIRPDIPVILYSGFSESQHRRASAESIFDAYVMKPMVTSELAAALSEVLAKYRARGAGEERPQN